jgi:2-oxoglutarate dehydrogenase E1 component
MQFALDFRMKFGRDIIDLLGYRKYGHNEGDEPRFTAGVQLLLNINPKRYLCWLLSEGVIDAGLVSH